MNQVLENILSRRSVRDYKPEQIPKESLEQILLAGRYAASGWNKQLWKFVAIQDRTVLDSVDRALKQSILNVDSKGIGDYYLKSLQRMAKSDYDLFYGAPTLVIITDTPNNDVAREDCALAAGNMMLMATELNIGSCWLNQLVNFSKAPEVKALFSKLGIPENYEIYSSVALGYATRDFKKIAHRKDDVATII